MATSEGGTTEDRTAGDDAAVSIRADGLRRSFGNVTAVDGVDLAVDGPEIIGVAGPNGSGKTTLIRCLLGLLAPSSGEATVNGTASYAFGAGERARLGYMPQHEAVYRDLTVRENVAFFARLYRVDNRAAAIDKALEFVDLRDRADARIGELSGGMVRRTSLACAVVHNPDVLFLDEPTVGLDPQLRAKMWAGFRKRRETGTLLVVSTHYLGEARNCDRVLFLRDGRVVAFDTPDAFLDRTGTDDLEAAFLKLVADRATTDSGSGGRNAEAGTRDGESGATGTWGEGT